MLLLIINTVNRSYKQLKGQRWFITSALLSGKTHSPFLVGLLVFNTGVHRPYIVVSVKVTHLKCHVHLKKKKKKLLL